MTIESIQLEPGERLIWAGHPNPWQFSIDKSWKFVLLGIPFFATFLIHVFNAKSYDIRSVATACLLLLVSAPFILSPLFFAYRAKRTTYAITDRRVVNHFSALPHRVASTLLTEIDAALIDKERRADGFGFIIFKDVPHLNWNRFHVERVGLFGISDVDRISELLKDAVEQAQRRVVRIKE